MSYLATLQAETKARRKRLGFIEIRPSYGRPRFEIIPTPAMIEAELPSKCRWTKPFVVEIKMTRHELKRAIMKLVCDEFRTPFENLVEKRRTADFNAARHALMYLLREVLAFSLPEIGRFIGGRDHTTVLHGLRRMQRERMAMSAVWVRTERLLRSINDLARRGRGAETFCYVRIEEADDYLRLGWIPTNALEGTHHGQYSVLMKWVCPTCHPIEPMILENK